MLAKSHGPFAITLGYGKKEARQRGRGSHFSYSTAENPIAPQNLFPPFMCAVLGWISPTLLASLRRFIVKEYLWTLKPNIQGRVLFCGSSVLAECV